MSDFIKFYTHFLDRISDLLVMTLSAHSESRVFFKVAIAKRQNKSESMLEIDMFQMSSDELIVDLPNIEPLQPYMILVLRSHDKRQLQLR